MTAQTRSERPAREVLVEVIEVDGTCDAEQVADLVDARFSCFR
ncbi:hypothetical protein [Amycolatopsis albispora]|nr:hypothetical protein [Amycolatopsis albispora]